MFTSGLFKPPSAFNPSIIKFKSLSDGGQACLMLPKFCNDIANV